MSSISSGIRAAIASARSARFHGTSAPSMSARGGPGAGSGSDQDAASTPGWITVAPPNALAIALEVATVAEARRDATRSSAPVTASGGRSWCSAMLARTAERGHAGREDGRAPEATTTAGRTRRATPASSRARPASSSFAAAVRPRRCADRARSGTTGTPAASASGSRRAREHHRPVERSGPVEQHAFGAAEHPGRRDEQHRPLGSPLRRHGRPRRSRQRVELPPRPRGVTAQQRMARGTARERQPLCRVVERQRARPRVALITARRRRASTSSGSPARSVAWPPVWRIRSCGWSTVGRPGRAGSQAEVHVLREQVDRSVERAEPRRTAVVPARHAPIAQPTVRVVSER